MARNISTKWLVLLVAIRAGAAMGQIVTDWTNDVGGTFDNSANWDLGVPGILDEAIFSNLYSQATNPYTLVFGADITNSSAAVAGDNVTLDLGGNNYALSSGSSTAPSLVVLGSGSLTVTSAGGVGTLSTNYAALGQSPGDTGTLTINDPNVNFTVAQTLWLGGTSTSHPGKGYLNINNGTVTVGTLRVLDTEGTGVVNLAGGILNVGTFDGLPTGFNWTAGTLNVTASRLVMDGVMPLGQNLTLNPGMTLSTSGTGAIELYPGSTLNLNGGTFPNTNALIVDYSATVNLNAGTFSRVTSETLGGNFVNNTTVSGPTTAGQYLTFTGSVTGSGSYTGNITFIGNFTPGGSAPTTVSLQNPTFGALNNLQLKLNSDSLMDHLDFSGTAVLGGELTVTLGKNFVPSLGQSFDFFDGSTTGSFASLNLPALQAGYAWNATQLYNNGVLSVGLANRWLSPSGGNFNDASNWSDGYAPPVSDSAVFNTGNATQYTVRFTSSASNDHIQVTGDNVIFDLGGNSYVLSNAGTIWPSLRVGVGGTGTLAVKSTGAAGVFSAGYVALGQSAGDSGSVTVNDPNVTWNISQTLSLGGSSTASGGSGVLNIGGGTVNIGTLKAWNTPGTAINLSGGTLSVANLEMSSTPSILNWTGGTLQIANTQGEDFPQIMSNGNLPTNLNINSGMALRIGGNGPNFVIDTGSDTLTVNGGQIIANTDGTTPTDTIIGELGPSNVDIKGGGTFTTDDSEIETATVTVQGAGSHWNTGYLSIGTGSLNLENGGLMASSVGHINGTTANVGSVSVDGTGSQWNCAGVVYIGDFSYGSLSVSNGGFVSDTAAYLGYATEAGGGRNTRMVMSSGIVTINDPASSWNTTGSVYVGGSATADEGSGAVTINSGTVTVGGTLKIWKPANSSTTATVTLAGGTLNVGTLDTTSTPANFVWTGGTLNVTSSDLHIGSTGPLGASLTLNSNMALQVSNGNLILDSGSSLTNSGSVIATFMDITSGIYISTGFTEIHGGYFYGGDQTVGGTFENLGTVAGPTTVGQYLTFTGAVGGCGRFAGNIAFAGSYTPDDPVTVTLDDNVLFESTNTLTMDIGGTVLGVGYDHLISTGQVTFGGMLEVQLINGFVPEFGETFELFAFSDLSGTFATLNLPTLASGLSWDASRLYDEGDGSIVVVPSPSAGSISALLVPFLLKRPRRCAI